MNQKETVIQLKKQISLTSELLAEAPPQSGMEDYLVFSKILLEKQLNALFSSAKIEKL